MQYQVYRTNSSTYQDSDFFRLEKNSLESIERVKYITNLKDIEEESSFILISNTHTLVDDLPEVLLENTVLMLHPNSGHENIDQNFVKKANFPIILGNPIRSHAVCEYVLSSIFNHFTQIPNQQYWSHDRKWPRTLVRDQKTLLIGFGTIGKKLYQSLKPICSKVLVYDPYIDHQFQNTDFINELNQENLKDISMVIIAASLTSTSRNLIDKRVLEMLHPHCLLINPARGEIINENELIKFLEKNESFYAYLDVFHHEPFNPGFMHNLKNVNKTSHIAGVYNRLNQDIINYEKHMIAEFIKFYSRNDVETFKKLYQDFILTQDSHNYN